MAGLENLPIYHEQQEAGSMLCAQHALNSLLQGNYFSAPDLSEIARNLDSLEESYDDENHGTRSGNMDDSGFFSVQVLDNALKVWGLNLSRWRGEEMRPFHDHPETQLAFILNYEQHWFTEWISKLYLGMVLQQAEADGYSVFAVTPADPSDTLPHTEVDDLASTIPEPQSASRPNLHSFTSHGLVVEGMEDEDYELQAALQASLMGDASPVSLPPLSAIADSPALDPAPQDIPSDLDPVAATMERNRLLLARMKAEQEYAQRQLWADEENQVARARDSEEEEMIRRAIEESEASARLEGHGTTSDSSLPPRLERVYDDDDAELQAALKASLEHVPEGWTLPSNSVELADAPSPPAPEEEVSVDELRRRRLARFGS
ncbi:Josephin-domain-containing protein [Mycena galopus ATCC 62051]|nr:Josephin-domain-containing protein [Mycena galopus ATCC 62051]